MAGKKNYFNCVLFILLLFQTACQVKFDFSKEKSVTEQVVEDLKTKKFLFIGENHDDVYPVLLLTENMQKFYDAGLRYFFLECGDDGFLSDTNMKNYSFDIVPPWCLYAWKYEQHLLEIEIEKMNSLHRSDPIKVFWPEYNLQLPDSDSGTDALNFRDYHIQKYIKQIMEKAKPSGKAIVLYGSGHGSKRPEKYSLDSKSESNWKMLGVYLSDYYHDNFVSYHISYMDFDNKKNKCVILSGKNYESFVPERFRGIYDYECASNNRVYGVIYPYVYNKENISALLNKVSSFNERISENNIGYEKNDEWQRIDALFAIYYLKYWLGDSFNFTYEDNIISLQESLHKLNCTKNKIDDAKMSGFSFDLSTLEKYSEFLMSYNHLENYLYSPANDERIDYVLHNMTQAKKINPRDIWPQYWIAYFETEKAVYSGKKNDYKKALASWEALLQNDLVYASPVLKLTYRKIALCEERAGYAEKAKFYQEKEQKVNPLIDIDYENYVIFGY